MCNTSLTNQHIKKKCEILGIKTAPQKSPQC
uniref:Uncharacterized protein n=1 Tax=Inoviridae sp. ctDEu7 TaxID=2826759 RepID=A0A8S5MUK1_9VIRU|nr:MAG TPA: hypothetical protein [Inoviridae sp. ctDEu7]